MLIFFGGEEGGGGGGGGGDTGKENDKPCKKNKDIKEDKERQRGEVKKGNKKYLHFIFNLLKIFDRYTVLRSSF